MHRRIGRASRTFAALAWLLAVGAGWQASGCGLDERNPGVESINTAGSGGGTGAADASTSLAGNGPCVESQGCIALPLQPCGPQQCPEVQCPADDVCKDYSDVIPPNNCRPGGACAGVNDCTSSWKPAAREGAACACDAAGCKLLAGEQCTRADVCASNNCVATEAGSNVCCAAACGPTEVCAPDGSACVLATPCTADDTRCSGAVFQHCSQGLWETVTDCGLLGCKKELAGCLRSAGQACETPEQCGEGSCLAAVDGNRVCCTAACDTNCRRCAAAGTACEDVEDDEACGTIECPKDEVCRNYDPPSVTANRCREGHCATPAEACTNFEPQKANSECSDTSLCDNQGNCSRPKVALLAGCSSSPECSSGACVATAAGGSVCCASACATNEVCSATGGCVLAPVCEDGEARCSGSDFQRCTAGQWRTVLACGTLGCSVERSGCLGGAGDDCSADTDCGVGRCQATSSGDRVCCTAVCDGSCRRCAASGAACENLADDPACGTIPCQPDQVCRDFPPSVTSQRCVAGRCGSAAQLCVGAPRASGQVCSNSNLCDASGNCSAPKKAPGAACSSGAECAQGNCVQGTCCNSACTGTCTASCTGGICRAPATDTRCSTGLCASAGVCQQASVACGNDTCILSNSICCSELTASGTTRVFCSPGTECPAPPNFVPDVPISCDDPTDCPSTQVCCLNGTSTSTLVSCKSPNPSPGTDETSIDFDSCAPLNPMLFGDRLCRTTQDCPAFESCRNTNDRVPGLTFCSPD